MIFEIEAFQMVDFSEYLDILDNLVNSNSNIFHRSIKKTPNRVDKSNWIDIQFKFEIDQVRIASQRMIFRKGYEA